MTTLADMMDAAHDAYIESFTSVRANDACRAIRDEIEAAGVTTEFRSLVTFDPFAPNLSRHERYAMLSHRVRDGGGAASIGRVWPIDQITPVLHGGGFDGVE